MSNEPKKPPTESAEALVCLMEQAAVHKIHFAEPIYSYSEAKDMLHSDDPMVWLVEEFGAVKAITSNFVYIPMDVFSWVISYHPKDYAWTVCDRVTSRPLTRDDVRRLCEIFGVEVKK